MKRTTVKIVPKLQNFDQKHHRMHIVQVMLTTFNDDPDGISILYLLGRIYFEGDKVVIDK